MRLPPVAEDDTFDTLVAGGVPGYGRWCNLKKLISKSFQHRRTHKTVSG